MRRIEREQRILNLLGEEPQVSVGQFAKTLSVSEATVRRELQDMEERGALRRVHGGATLAGVHNEPLFTDKQTRNSDAKQGIAEAALALVSDNSSIYLDGGSTVLTLAKILHKRRNLTIVTNSLMAAASLMETSHRLILVGGEFRSLSRTLVGPLTGPLIESLHVDIAFMGTMGFSPEEGMTTTDPSEAFSKAAIMRRATRVVLLMHSSKFGRSALARSGTAADIHTLITEAADSDTTTRLTEAGIELIALNKE
ncbi:MAG: DeoR family fructose operon transcriptional repressor [Rhodothermales bacterium]|jgi:DeoR family fructose operon transcriptional repressor